MHPAIELLMKRMESNPDEFVRGHLQDRTWGSLIERYKEYMTKEDRDALRARYSEIQMGQFHREVMAELLRDPKEELGSTEVKVSIGGGGGGSGRRVVFSQSDLASMSAYNPERFERVVQAWKEHKQTEKETL